MSFLIDTDICSGYLRGEPKLFNPFLQFAGRLHVSTIVVGELYTWAFRKAAPTKRIDALHSFLEDVMILDYDREVALRFGQLHAQLLDLGRPKGFADLSIASTALVHDLTLVTHNTKDYEDVTDLRIEDWLLK